MQVKHGIVQYRIDCGSGEGIARLEGVFVNDDKWHELSVQRHGRHVSCRFSHWHEYLENKIRFRALSSFNFYFSETLSVLFNKKFEPNR